MKTYVFLGNEAQLVGRAVFTERGQRIEMEPAEAERHIQNDFPLIPEDLYLKAQGEPGDLHINAAIALADFRNSLSARVAPAEE